MSAMIQSISRFSPRKRPLRDLEIINHAQTLAVLAHSGQTRKDGVTPQILHPMLVQGLLASCGISDPVIHGAALLHDGFEDNPGKRGQALMQEMERSMPVSVLETVLMLTDPHGLPTDTRKALQLDRLMNASWEARVIKLADVVASLQEGPAPSWSEIKKQAYVQQRKKLVYQSLGKPCGRLQVMFERALRLPAWQCLS